MRIADNLLSFLFTSLLFAKSKLKVLIMHVHRSSLFLKSYIDNNYDVVFKSRDVSSDFANANEFLLCETHDSNGCNEVNSLFINLFARKNDIVMIEAIPAMQKIAPCDALQSIYLKTDAQIVGWDLGTVESMGFGNFSAGAEDLEISARIQLKNLADPLFTGEREDVVWELRSICSRIYYHVMPTIMEKNKALLEHIAATFPPRVKVMESSLKQARTISNRTFLIAGKWHLEQTAEKDPRYSLASFYAFLTCRHTVILKPKAEVIAEIDAKTMNTLREYFPK